MKMAPVGIISQVSNTTFVWSITGFYTLVKQKELGVHSPDFAFDNSSWDIAMYKTTNEPSQFTNFSLWRRSYSVFKPRVKATYRLFIKDVKDKEYWWSALISNEFDFDKREGTAQKLRDTDVLRYIYRKSPVDVFSLYVTFDSTETSLIRAGSLRLPRKKSFTAEIKQRRRTFTPITTDETIMSFRQSTEANKLDCSQSGSADVPLQNFSSSNLTQASRASMEVEMKRLGSLMQNGTHKEDTSLNHLNSMLAQLNTNLNQNDTLVSPSAIVDSRKASNIGPSDVTPQPSTTPNLSEAVDSRGVDKLLQDLKDSLINGQHHDVMLKVRGKEFRANKAILKAASPVFSDMFQHDKNGDVIDIPDCDPEAFHEFLIYLYSGRVENLTKFNVVHLYGIAKIFGVEDLAADSVEFMQSNFSLETFCGFATIAIRHSESALLESANKFFSSNMVNIIVTGQWKSFLKENPSEANEFLVKAVATGTISNSTARFFARRIKSNSFNQ